MFNKNKFAQVLKEINETYDSQRDFAKKSDINRTYLSQYMNMKLEEPPQPKILKKLANSSNGIISYTELMNICGYVNPINMSELLKSDNILELVQNCAKDTGSVILELNLNTDDFSKEEEEILQKYFNLFKKDINVDINTLIKSLPVESQNKILREYNKFHSDFNCLTKNLYVQEKIKKDAKFYMCPVYGRISAGQPNWAEECIEGRLPIDPVLFNIINPEEHFFLRVNGESMNKVIKNGAYALIHKQDIVDDGEIAVVLVNGYEATLKHFTKKGDIVVLEPDSDVTDDPDIKTQIYDKNTSIKILGKYVGKFEMK